MDELALPGRHYRGLAHGESFIVDHARRSVIPERLADIVLDRIPAASSGGWESNIIDDEQYYHLTHFTDALMTDQEVIELPKVWVVAATAAWATSATRTCPRSSCKTGPTSRR